jgi:hypothetical protein
MEELGHVIVFFVHYQKCRLCCDKSHCDKFWVDPVPDRCPLDLISEALVMQEQASLMLQAVYSKSPFIRRFVTWSNSLCLNAGKAFA